MTYQIMYGNDKLVANSIEERNAYANVLKDIGVDYTVDEQYLVALVQFQNDSRVYTYFTREVLPDFSYAVVESSEWRAGEEKSCYKIVTVIRCTMRTKSELEKICPLSRYKWVQGVVAWNK